LAAYQVYPFCVVFFRQRVHLQLTENEFALHSNGKAFLQSTSLAVRARLNRHLARAVAATSNLLQSVANMRKMTKCTACCNFLVPKKYPIILNHKRQSYILNTIL